MSDRIIVILVILTVCVFALTNLLALVGFEPGADSLDDRLSTVDALHPTSAPDASCVAPVISGFSPAQGGDGAGIVIKGSNFAPLALVYVGDTLHQVYKSEPNRLFILIQPGARGVVRVENRCPDGRSFSDTSAIPFVRRSDVRHFRKKA